MDRMSGPPNFNHYNSGNSSLRAPPELETDDQYRERVMLRLCAANCVAIAISRALEIVRNENNSNSSSNDPCRPSRRLSVQRARSHSIISASGMLYSDILDIPLDPDLSCQSMDTLSEHSSPEPTPTSFPVDLELNSAFFPVDVSSFLAANPLSHDPILTSQILNSALNPASLQTSPPPMTSARPDEEDSAEDPGLEMSVAGQNHPPERFPGDDSLPQPSQMTIPVAENTQEGDQCLQGAEHLVHVNVIPDDTNVKEELKSESELSPMEAAPTKSTWEADLETPTSAALSRPDNCEETFDMSGDGSGLQHSNPVNQWRSPAQNDVNYKSPGSDGGEIKENPAAKLPDSHGALTASLTTCLTPTNPPALAEIKLAQSGTTKAELFTVSSKRDTMNSKYSSLSVQGRRSNSLCVPKTSTDPKAHFCTVPPNSPDVSDRRGVDAAAKTQQYLASAKKNSLPELAADTSKFLGQIQRSSVQGRQCPAAVTDTTSGEGTHGHANTGSPEMSSLRPLNEAQGPDRATEECQETLNLITVWEKQDDTASSEFRLRVSSISEPSCKKQARLSRPPLVLSRQSSRQRLIDKRAILSKANSLPSCLDDSQQNFGFLLGQACDYTRRSTLSSVAKFSDNSKVAQLSMSGAQPVLSSSEMAEAAREENTERCPEYMPTADCRTTGPGAVGGVGESKEENDEAFGQMSEESGHWTKPWLLMQQTGARRQSEADCSGSHHATAASNPKTNKERHTKKLYSVDSFPTFWARENNLTEVGTTTTASLPVGTDAKPRPVTEPVMHSQAESNLYRGFASQPEVFHDVTFCEAAAGSGMVRREDEDTENSCQEELSKWRPSVDPPSPQISRTFNPECQKLREQCLTPCFQRKLGHTSSSSGSRRLGGSMRTKRHHRMTSLDDLLLCEKSNKRREPKVDSTQSRCILEPKRKSRQLPVDVSRLSIDRRPLAADISEGSDSVFVSDQNLRATAAAATTAVTAADKGGLIHMDGAHQVGHSVSTLGSSDLARATCSQRLFDLLRICCGCARDIDGEM